MKSYKGVISTEVVLLLLLIVVMTGRGKLLWASLLGQTQVCPNPTPPTGASPKGAMFTTVGIIAGAIVAIRYGEGDFGLGVAWFLGILLVAVGLLNYQKLLGMVVTNPTTPAPQKG